MDGIRKYSKEWFTLKGTEEQRNAIEGLKGGIDKKTSGSIEKSIFTGSLEDVQQKYDTHSAGVHGAPSSTQLNVRDYGLENIFNALDINGDGEVTEDEINDIAALNTSEFATTDNTTLSTEDLDLLYKNAMDAVNASVINMGDKTEFHYENGDVTKIYIGSDGKMSQKYVEERNDDGTKTGISYTYADKSTTRWEYDEQGRVSEIERKTSNEKKNYTKNITYNEDNSRTVTTKDYVATTDRVYDSNGKFVSKDAKYNYDSDGIIGDTAQQSIGDCWVLAGVNALNTSDAGKAILKNAIQQNDDGSVTVTLKGVGKQYTYSAEEIIDNKYNTPSKSYSTGDTDMNLFEMAIGDYRRELIESGDYVKNGRDLSRTAGKDATVNDPLNGGQIDEAIYYITGYTSQFSASKKDVARDMINKIEGSVNKYIMNVSFKEKDESIGAITTGHAYTVSNVDEENVYVINPWDSSVEIAYPKEKFLDNAFQSTLTDITPQIQEHTISAPKEGTIYTPKGNGEKFMDKIKNFFAKIIK